MSEDLRRALRSLLAEPSWTAVAVLTLALGTGANTAIFTVVDHALLRPLPYPEAQRLVAVWGVEAGSGSDRSATSYPDFRDVQRDARASFLGFAAYRRFGATLTGPGLEPARLDAAVASRELFALLGATPLLGRVYSAEEDAQGASPTVLLSETVWRERWGGRRDVLGQSVLLDSRPHTIVGVMPASFAFPRSARLWVAAGPQPRNEFRGVHGYRVVARLAPGASRAAADAELATVTARLARAYPDDNAGRSARVEPLQEAIVSSAGPSLRLLLGAVVLVLLITCANLAALLVARASRRARDLAVRVSLGATRGRLLRELLAEAAVLAALGTAAGLALAAWGVPALVALAPADLPRLEEVALDRRVALVAFAASVATALAFSLAPAFLATRVDPAAALRAGAHGASAGPARQRLRQALTLAQTTLAVVLLTGAGLLVRSLLAVHAVEPGFATEGLLAAEVQLPEARYRTWRDWAGFGEQVRARLQQVPGVQAAAVASGQPFDEGWGARFEIEGRPPFPHGQEPEPAVRLVSPGYLKATGIRLLRGRDLDDRDSLLACAAERAPVTPPARPAAGAPPPPEPCGPGTVLVNEAMARRFFPGEDPVGRVLVREWWAPEMPRRYTIVGVVADVRTGALEGEPQEAIYYASTQVAFAGLTLLVRSSREASALAVDVRAAVAALDPELPLFRVRTIEQVLAESLGTRRFHTTVLGLFATLALVLAAVGLYGVLAYSVLQRRKEIAVRVALGALRRDVAALVAGQALRVAGGGLVLGIAGALALSRLARALLYGVRPADAPTLAGVVLALAATAALAAWAPLRRALAVDPARALRGE